MLAEAIRLIFMLAVAVGGAYLERIWQPTFIAKNYALILFILLGTAVGYVLGGIVGRKLEKTVSWIEEKTNQITASELVMGVGGLILGLVISSLMAQPIKEALKPITAIAVPYVNMVVYFVFGYLGFNVFIRKKTKVDFLSGISADFGNTAKAILIDSSVAIDGRITELVRMGFINDRIIIPRFIVNELQGIADSGDDLRRVRGRRGLDVLQILTKEASAEILEKDYPDLVEPDDKLVKMASELKTSLATNDYNLAKVAGLEKIRVLNLNELATRLRPVVLAGESLNILVVKKGKEKDQGIGYLDDGTMVVVEGGKDMEGQRVEVIVSSVLQTSAGKMIFSRLKKEEK
jgi:uncharacterized protein YacL